MELLLLPLPYLVHSDPYGHFHGLSAHWKTLYVTSRPEHMKAWPPTGTPGNPPVTNVPRILDLVWAQDARAQRRCRRFHLWQQVHLFLMIYLITDQQNHTEWKKEGTRRELRQHKQDYISTQLLSGLNFLVIIKHHWFTAIRQQRCYHDSIVHYS